MPEVILMSYRVCCQFREQSIDSFIKADLFQSICFLTNQSLDCRIFFAFGWFYASKNLVARRNRIFLDRLAIFGSLAEKLFVIRLLFVILSSLPIRNLVNEFLNCDSCLGSDDMLPIQLARICASQVSIRPIVPILLLSGLDMIMADFFCLSLGCTTDNTLDFNSSGTFEVAKSLRVFATGVDFLCSLGL